MAAFEEGLEVGDGEALLNEAAPAPAGRSRAKLLAPLFAAGLCGAALYAFAPRAAGPAGPAAAATAGAVELAEGRKPLLIEGDLGRFVTHEGQPPPGAVLSSAGGTAPELPEAAGKLFEHVVAKSGVDQELTAEELAAYKQRFVDSMVEAKGANQWWVQDYIGTSKQHIERTKPVMTAALASSINAAQQSYTVAMRDWMLHESQETYQARLGRTPFEARGDVMERLSHKNFGVSGGDEEPLPEHFDSREKWPKCKDVIDRIHNQGNCGDCWVFGAMGPLDSRLCIHTDGAFSGEKAWLSRGFGASCAVNYNGCNGGWEYYVYQYVEKSRGLVTESCNPYFAGTDYAHHWDSHMAAPACPTSCEESTHRSFEKNLFRPLGVQKYRLVLHPDAAGIEDMKRSMLQGGPVAFGIFANSPFMGYTDGIFDGSCGGGANHAVHAIGWGAGYILGQNSWGTKWGLEGRFKVAPCVPTDFTVPGAITQDSYPLPLA